MTRTPPPNAGRSRTGWILVAVLAALVIVVGAFGVLTSGILPTASPSTPAAAPTASSTPALGTVLPTASATPTVTPSATAPSSASPTPQPTKTAALSSPQTITKSLTATVTKQVAVKGKATQPGEIAGAAVQFTITISNRTGKAVDLSSAVVNAYSGADSSPAGELTTPGGRSFPASVANGSTVSGVYLFTIPVASRSNVEVTVDTGVGNPVVAFKGAAPK